MEAATLTVEQAGRLLGVGRNLAYEAVARGDIPSVRIGRRILVPRAALMAMLEDPKRATGGGPSGREPQ